MVWRFRDRCLAVSPLPRPSRPWVPSHSYWRKADCKKFYWSFKVSMRILGLRADYHSELFRFADALCHSVRFGVKVYLSVQGLEFWLMIRV